jgi:radical SAM enzyme (TIGR01210 family)
MDAPDKPTNQVENQILDATRRAQKEYNFNEAHDPNRPADLWFQESDEGQILFVVFYTQACRWSRCLGCNLPAKMSQKHVSYRALMAQIDWLFSQPEVVKRCAALKKVIVSNNGSVLDEKTFSSTALMYLIAKLNLHLPNLSVLTLETRVEYVDQAELEFIARALQEGDTATNLELAIGFEAFDEHIRNGVFNKGLSLERFEGLCRLMAPYGYQLKCYLMQKPVPGMSDEQAIQDVHRAIDYLSGKATEHGLRINLHLNPTYVAFGTALERSFRRGEYSPPRLRDVARAALHGEDKDVSIFLGLSDENLAVEGGSFIRAGEEAVIAKLEQFNRMQAYNLLREVAATGSD